jgi:hypothetical protein
VELSAAGAVRHSGVMSTRTRLNLYATLVAALGFVLLAFTRV